MAFKRIDKAQWHQEMWWALSEAYEVQDDNGDTWRVIGVVHPPLLARGPEAEWVEVMVQRISPSTGLNEICVVKTRFRVRVQCREVK